MEWFKELPVELQAAAYTAGEEHAWGRADALKVLSWLAQRGFIVFGIDIWLPTVPGPTIPTPYVYDWDMEANSGGRLSPSQNAIEFISSFKWAADDKYCQELPYFAIGPVELRH